MLQGDVIRIEEPRNDDPIGLGKSLDEILLEDGPPAGGRAWFKDRPEPMTIIPGAQGGKCFTDGCRVMREIVNDGDLADDTSDLLPPLHAGEGLQALADSLE